MRTITTLLLGVFLLTLIACEDKKDNSKGSPEANGTEIFTEKDLKKRVSTTYPSDINHSQYSDTFTVKSTQNKSYTFSMSGKNIYSDSFRGKTIVLNISHISSPTSLDQMESLSKVQAKHQSNSIVISLLLGDIKEISTPNIFLNKHHIYHFVSFAQEQDKLAKKIYQSLQVKENTMPLTIIYKDGKYYSHFEGNTPLEMINHDIKQTIKK